jgi:hypothetical protein
LAAAADGRKSLDPAAKPSAGVGGFGGGAPLPPGDAGGFGASGRKGAADGANAGSSAPGGAGRSASISRGGQAPAAEAAPKTDAFSTPGLVAGGEVREGEKGEASAGRGLGAAPASLYFNPRLATDADGYATIEFQMPAAEADYRILIDAFGNGRVGSAEMLIMCRK